MNALDIRIYDTAQYYSWESWFRLTSDLLLAAPVKATAEGSDVFTDAYSGAKLTVTSVGDDVTAIALAAPVPIGGKMCMRPLFKMSVADGVLDRDALVSALDAHAQSNGFDSALKDLLSPLSVSLEFVDTPDFETNFGSGTSFLGSPGDDVFVFAFGKNIATGSGGNDTYVGNAGFDTIHYDDLGPLHLTVDGTDRLLHKADGSIDRLSGIERLTGGAADDDFRCGLGDGGSDIFGGDGDDIIGGGRRRDMLDGGGGDDTLYGRAGSDLLMGSLGADILRGGRGKDVLIGTYGFNWFRDETDHLRGGRGADMFVIAVDEFIDDTSNATNTLLAVIEDFTDGRDLIGLMDRGWHSETPEDWLDYVNLDIRDSDAGAVIAFHGVDLALVEGTAAGDLTREDFVQRVDLERLATQYYYDWS